MESQVNLPVFYDPQSHRWRVFKRSIKILSLGFLTTFGIFLFSIGIHPGLPGLDLPSIHTSLKSHASIAPHNKTLVNKFKKYTVDQNTYPSGNVNLSESSVETERIGFYVNWDSNSFNSLQENINQLDKLIPEWLHLSTTDGDIIINDLNRQNKTLTYIHSSRPDLKIIPLINNFDHQNHSFDGFRLAQLLANSIAREKLINNLLSFVRDNNFAGIHIDFEDLPSNSQSNLLIFMGELYRAFHPLGLEVSQSVPLDNQDLDYSGLSDVNDFLVLMAYDEHSSISKPGPIASQEWYVDRLEKRLAEVPAQRLVIAIGNYGYDWQENATLAKSLKFQDALKISQESKGEVYLDPQSLNETFDYYDEKYQLHHVWFLDAITAFNQVVVAQRQGVRGFALWRMGAEDPSTWKVWQQRMNLNQAAAKQLSLIHYGYYLNYEGTGEVLKVTATPQDGKRNVTYDRQLGLIINQNLMDYPSPYVITRWGSPDQNKIALTFDDGPDRRYTPRILEILRHYQARATFFVIGMNGIFNPDLLQQIIAEGHEIGSHTFTHPNIALISQQQLELELNSTQRLLESIVGRCSVLFRPPYAVDVEPETPEEVAPLQLTGRLGYYTIGMQIEPLDWKNPGVDEIVAETIKQAEDGRGKVVLLHDSGGDRSQTVAALPRIIEGLRQRGFELVTVSDLINLSPDQVMPPIPQRDQLLVSFDRLGFLAWDQLGLLTYWLFMIGVGLSVTRLLFIICLALYEWQGRRRKHYDSDYQPWVSVLVPAFNEEKVIVKTVNSILRSYYPNFNIIAIDDGSKDGTYSLLLKVFGSHPHVRVLTKPNGGKSAALNYGITRTDADLIVTLDADTVLRPDALGKLVRHFSHPQVGAIAGNAKVGNRINILTYWQALEYIASQNLERRALSLLNCISVVPGAIGAWRREVLLKAGGFVNDTLAEDTDLTLTVLEMGYRVDYEENAIALTEAPDTVGAFLQQRFRWMFGTLQATWKHRRSLFRLRYGFLGTFAIPNILVFQIIFPLISPLMDLLMVCSVLWASWQQSQHPDGSAPGAVQQIFLYYIIFLSIDFLAAFIAFSLERKEDWKLIIWLLPQRFLYRQLLYYVAIKSTLKAIQGQLVGWGKLERKSTVFD
ncbi:MAG: glycosyltransferase [Nodosilinea sp. LVE1205-7]|jgi:cellulose synthase/poly-beta-1,6-N-acetylglucosamine synthase-like glycosyltransferase/peptidoglycan/xylan/chitin deacetylase (PgdA/CDA1 family)/spore germination protein YaaH